MGKQGPFNDPNGIKWRWIGEGKQNEENRKIFYKSAEVIRMSDGLKRTFKIGDTVCVASEKGRWIGHIVELYNLGTIDDEVEIVEDTNPLQCMRCTLRWLYGRSDIEQESLRMSPEIPRSVPGELYFSDHVEKSGSNSIEVIESLAFLCPTPDIVDHFKNSPPKIYWEGDTVRLVRCFYGTNNGSPPPIRELEREELKFLLDNPSTDTHLYRSARPYLYGVTGAVMKGIGKNSKHQPGSYSVRGPLPGTAARHATRKSPGRSQDFAANDDVDVMSLRAHWSQSKGNNRSGSSSKRDKDYRQKIKRKLSPGKTRRRIVLESSDDDSDELVATPSPRVRPNSSRVIEIIEKSGNVHSAKNTNSNSSKKTMNTPDPRMHRRRLNARDVDPANNDVLQSPEVKKAFQKVSETMKTVPPEEAPFVYENLRNMFTLITGAMAEGDLTFNMGEKDKNAVAQVVAQKLFGRSAADAASSGVSNARNSSSRPVNAKSTDGHD